MRSAQALLLRTHSVLDGIRRPTRGRRWKEIVGFCRQVVTAERHDKYTVWEWEVDVSHKALGLNSSAGEAFLKPGTRRDAKVQGFSRRRLAEGTCLTMMDNGAPCSCCPCQERVINSVKSSIWKADQSWTLFRQVMCGWPKELPKVDLKKSNQDSFAHKNNKEYRTPTSRKQKTQIPALTYTTHAALPSGPGQRDLSAVFGASPPRSPPRLSRRSLPWQEWRRRSKARGSKNPEPAFQESNTRVYCLVYTSPPASCICHIPGAGLGPVYNTPRTKCGRWFAKGPCSPSGYGRHSRLASCGDSREYHRFYML